MNTFDIKHTENIEQPKQTKKWFIERVDKSIYSFQLNSGYYVSNKEQAEILLRTKKTLNTLK